MKEINKSERDIRQLLPVMLIGFVTIVMYTIFVTFYCMVLLQINVEKQYVDNNLLKEGYTKLITFHILLFLLIWSFYKTCRVDPGTIPDTHEWLVEPDVNRINEREQTGELRFCIHEQKYKPDRAHYCRAIKKNVLKMDHYCPWNYTTLEFCVIGQKNKKNIYDLEIEENFKQVLGDNILFWFLPVGKPKGDGLFFKTT